MALSRMSEVRRWIRAGLMAVVFVAGPHEAAALSIKEALALAYTNNPELNARRAQVRATDEAVPLAKAQLRPQISFSADKGYQHREFDPARALATELKPGGFEVRISQTLWDSFKTRNDVAAAKAGVFVDRELLRNVQQNTLFDAAAAFMDVIRDRAISGYRESSLDFLNELLRSERARLDVGEATRTDVAQSEAQRARAQSELSAAQAQLRSSSAVFRQVIGIEPGALSPGNVVDRLIPNRIDRALEIGFTEHPAIMAARYAVDQADWRIKSAESDLLPRVTLEGSSSRRYDTSIVGDRLEEHSVLARLTVPIYQGGRVSATVRQNKETLGQLQLETDGTVDSVRTAIVSAYSQFESAKGSISANESQLRAARLALEGTVEERNVGQSTTLDVLLTEQEVINAQIALANSSREVIVAGYAILSAIGRLEATQIGLQVVEYDPTAHYEVVKDKWFGLRTPDGR